MKTKTEEKSKEQKIKEAHELLVKGLTNGLSMTFKDKRTEDKDFWEKRSCLFDVFTHYVMDVIWKNKRSSEIHFEELGQIAEEGYKLTGGQNEN